MNKRQAKKIALEIAYAAVIAQVDAGSAYDRASEEDAEKVTEELEKIARSLLARWQSSAACDR